MKLKKLVKILIYIFFVVLIYVLLFNIFKVDEIEEEEIPIIESVEDNDLLPTPDRIVYKNINNEYMQLEPNTNEYNVIYTELYNRMKNTIEGKVYSEMEITSMQNRGSFVEFDYNTKSKNYIFFFDESEVGIIKRFTDSGQVLKTSLDNKIALLKKLDKLAEGKTKYDFNTEYNYTSENKLTSIPENLNFNEASQEVYQKIITSEQENYKDILEKLNFKNTNELPNIDFNKYKVILTIAKYEIKNIMQNIGNIKYEFGEFLDTYTVNFLAVSKIVNSNCIYYNLTNLSENTTAIKETNPNVVKDDYAVDYYIENSKYYSSIGDKKVELISLEKACDIADKEAEDSKYQYQPWKSEFYTRGKDKNDYISAELISNLSSISKYSHWKEEWKKSDYSGKLMWKIRLFDENDPLTSLYIYIDAIDGDVIGAGASSD